MPGGTLLQIVGGFWTFTDVQNHAARAGVSVLDKSRRALLPSSSPRCSSPPAACHPCFTLPKKRTPNRHTKIQVLDMFKAQDEPLPQTLQCAKELLAAHGTFPSDAVIPPPGVTPLNKVHTQTTVAYACCCFMPKRGKAVPVGPNTHTHTTLSVWSLRSTIPVVSLLPSHSALLSFSSSVSPPRYFKLPPQLRRRAKLLPK